MPGGDGTGPMGHGPMTGKKLGLCAGYSSPGYPNTGYGQGLGRGWGRGLGRGYLGRGRGFWWRGYPPEPYFQPTLTKEEEKKYLENIVKGLEEEIKEIRERIKGISEEK